MSILEKISRQIGNSPLLNPRLTNEGALVGIHNILDNRFRAVFLREVA